jgi:uncharacterized membrane protein
MHTTHSAAAGSRRPALGLHGGAALIGFALGGFFDGILLHQVLQWHHLLSGLDGPGWQDLRVQVLADGIFHLLMYVVAVAGLWLLLRSRSRLAEAGAQRQLAASAAIGFGTWHAIDAVLSHWWLGLHRIRMDVSQPLAWDVGWLVLFGLLPMLAGWRLARRPGGGAGAALAGWMAMATVAAAVWAARPDPGTEGRLTVLLAPGAAPAQALHAVSHADARVAWVNERGTVWVMALPAGASARGGWREQALVIPGRWTAAACAAWVAPGRI